MKRKWLLATVGAMALGIAAPASAADLPRKAPIAPPPPLPYNWNGFYIGGHIGGAWVDHDVSDPFFFPGFSVSTDKSGFIGGGQVGWNFQTGQWVFGIEGDISATDLSRNHLCPDITFSCDHKLNWIATATGRLGLAWDAALFYVKGGAAFANHEVTVFDNLFILPTVSGSTTRTGWTVGAGFEYGFAPNWSAKIEYNFMDFGNEDFTMFGVNRFLNVDTQINVVKFGINYRFGWGPPPLTASY